MKLPSRLVDCLHRITSPQRMQRPTRQHQYRLQILSDLHLEVGQQYASFSAPVTAPLLVLAGDIGRLVDYDALLHGFLAHITPQYCRVFYVLGNHEFYGLDYDTAITEARRLEREPVLHGKLTLLNGTKWVAPGECACPLGANCIRSLNSESTPTKPLTVLGCTLWSAVPADSAAIVQAKLSDFSKISGWTVAQHNAQHAREAAWLGAEVDANQEHTPERGPVCVITHHAPTLQGTSSPQHTNSPWNSGFATELLGDNKSVDASRLVKKSKNAQTSTWAAGVDLWVFGHTHHCVDDMCYGVHLVANQRGYVFGNVSFGSVQRTPTADTRVFDPGMVVGL